MSFENVRIRESHLFLFLPLLLLCGCSDPGKEAGLEFRPSLEGSKHLLSDAITRARSLDGAGDRAGAAAAWEEVLALRPGHATALYASAVLRWRDGDGAGALARLAALREAEPGGGRGYLLAAAILGDPAAGSLRDPEGAVAMAAAALERNPEESGTHLALGRALLLAGRTGEAAARLAVAAGMNPRDPDARSLLGVLAFREGRREEAAARFREALRAAAGAGVGALHGGVPGEGDTEAALDPSRAPSPGELRAAAGLHALGAVVKGAPEGEPMTEGVRERVLEALRARGSGETLLDLDGDGAAEGAAVQAGTGFGAAFRSPGGPVALRR